MPVFSCGGMRYQQSWTDLTPEQIPAANQENLERTIARSLEVGINHIETARGYGSSEMQLGWVLPRYDRDRLIVQTKVAPYADPKEFLATFNKSMDYLNLEHVELLSLHGINNLELLDWTVRSGGCLEVARQLQREGRCRFIGFSTHACCGDILAAINTGEFDYVNLHWYYVNPWNWAAIEAANRLDMGVFIISPNDKGGRLYEPPAKLVDLCAPLTPMAWNDLYCLRRPEVHTLSLGAARPSDFDAHLAALKFYGREQEIELPITRRIDAVVEGVWGREFLEHWPEGLPDWERLPGQVNVWETVRLWIYAKALDLHEWAKMRYNLMGQAGHWFPGLKAVDVDWSALDQALAPARYRKELLEIVREAHDALNAAAVKRLSQE